MRYRLELPAHQADVEVRAFVERWLDTPALRRLVESDGGTWPTGSLVERLDALHEFSEQWDFRGGAERLELRSEPLAQDPARIFAAAEELGLTVAHDPQDSRYDHALVLGGTALANVNRVRRLYELKRHGVEVDQVAVLTALRELSDQELAIARGHEEASRIVGDARSEFDVMVQAVASYSGAEPEVQFTPNPNPHLANAEAVAGDTLVLAAPSADPDRRANTRDNYDAYIEHIGSNDSVLIVTSSVYLPYQFFVALQAIGWQEPRTIEAVGFPPEWMGGVLTGPENVLQEMRSAIFGAQAMANRLDDVTGGA